MTPRPVQHGGGVELGSRLDGLAQPHLVCKQHALGKGEASANGAASTWCGFMSTRAVDRDCEGVLTQSLKRDFVGEKTPC